MAGSLELIQTCDMVRFCHQSTIHSRICFLRAGLTLYGLFSNVLKTLINVDFYNRWVDSTKMEAASFQLYDASKNKFQVSDPDSYYVHHMSSYEHLLHRKVGYDVAKNATIVLSKAAIKGECDNLVISDTREYLALIPFFGGLPPDVTVDMKVKSIGQGNSLVRCSQRGDRMRRE